MPHQRSADLQDSRIVSEVPEDAGKDGVDVGELAGVVEGVGQFFGGEAGGDFGDFGDFVAEDEVLFPTAHGVLLDETVGVFAGHAGFGEIEEKLAGEDEAAGGFEVLQHAGGVDEEFFDQRGGFLEQVVGEDGGVGQDDALGGGVGDVALVPEGYILEGGLRV